MAQASRTRLQVDERRAQLLELGLSLFSEHSYEELSIGEIAKAAGISKGLLYHYFPSKRDFYVAALRLAAEQLVEETSYEVESVAGEPDLDSMRRGLHAYLGFVDEHAEHYAFVMRGGMGNDPDAQEIVEQTRARYVDRMLEGLGREDTDARVRLSLRGFVGFVEARRAWTGWSARTSPTTS